MPGVPARNELARPRDAAGFHLLSQARRRGPWAPARSWLFRIPHEEEMARRSVPDYERLRRLRQDPRVGYPAAFGCVIASTAVQWWLRDLAAVESFGAFYLAVIVSTLVGGTGPGALRSEEN